MNLGNPMKLDEDNKSVINIAKMKHIKINSHFIEEKLKCGLNCIIYASIH